MVNWLMWFFYEFFDAEKGNRTNPAWRNHAPRRFSPFLRAQIAWRTLKLETYPDSDFRKKYQEIIDLGKLRRKLAGVKP